MPSRTLIVSFLLVSWGLILARCDKEAKHPDVTLHLAGADASERDLGWDDLQGLGVIEGWGGYLTSVGRIEGPSLFAGVRLEDVLELGGGLPAGKGARLEAGDGYYLTLSATQIALGDLPAFDPVTGEDIAAPTPLTVALVWARDGADLPAGDGPLRLAVLSEAADQVTDGHLWVKDVRRVSVVDFGREWTLDLEGVLTEHMDRATFETGAVMGCHGFTWTDERAMRWDGIPLWLLVGRVDDQNVHETGAFNRSLAAAGYSVDVVTDASEVVTLTSARLAENNEIILAHRVNDNPLDAEHFPLRLAGADLEESERVGRVTRIVIHLP